MNIKVYNTLTQKKQDFIPIRPGEITMYVCGITPYDMSHIGHARAYVCFDVIYRYFKYLGYKVKYVRNFTDIDDKIIKKAEELGKDIFEVSNYYINEFYKDMDALKVLRPDVEPKVTETIPQIIDFISKIIENGYAYVLDGDVYFEIEKFKDYGKLSKRDINDMIAGASERVSVEEKKKHPLDFALWKRAKKGEPFWDSPWGQGRPGWHIECSTMSFIHLGEQFDIHGGGQDLIFPHHENEIAQSEAVFGEKHVNYWLHNGFVQVNEEKMSKSLGNFFTIREVIQNYHPEALRFFLISTHYRKPINYSTENIEDASSRLGYLYETLNYVKDYLTLNNEALDENLVQSKEIFDNMEKKFVEVMNDDFNTPEAIALLSEPFKFINDLIRKKKSIQKTSTFKYFLLKLEPFRSVLGILTDDPDKILIEMTELALKRKKIDREWIEKKLEERIKARRERNYELSDKIREELLKLGITIMDTPDKTIWRIY